MTYLNIQVMRGMAALLVLTMHLLSMIATLYEQNGADAGLITKIVPYSRPLGLVGVDIFFIISGFVMLLSARRTARTGTALRFAFNRFLRVYPLYWVVFVFNSISTSIVYPSFMWNAVTNWQEILLVDSTNRYDVVPPAWTLMYEIYFYVGISGVLLIWPRQLNKALIGWVILHFVLIFANRIGWIGTFNPVTDAILMDFAAGMALAHFASKGQLPGVKYVMLACIPILGAGFVFLSIQDQPGQVDRVWRFLTFGIFSIGLVYVAVAAEQIGRLFLPSFRWLGDASYSIYVWHVPVFWTLNWTGYRLGLYNFEHPYLTAFVWGSAALVIASLSYRWLERPLLDWMRRGGLFRQSIPKRDVS